MTTKQKRMLLKFLFHFHIHRLVTVASVFIVGVFKGHYLPTPSVFAELCQDYNALFKSKIRKLYWAVNSNIEYRNEFTSDDLEFLEVVHTMAQRLKV